MATPFVEELHAKISNALSKGDSTNWELGELISDLLKVQDITFAKLAEQHGCSEERVRSAFHVFDRFNHFRQDFTKLSWSHFAASLAIDHGEALTLLAAAQMKDLSVAEFKRSLNPTPAATEDLPHTFGEGEEIAAGDPAKPSDDYAPYRQGAGTFFPITQAIIDDAGDAHAQELMLTAKVTDLIKRILPRLTDDTEAAIATWLRACHEYDQGGTSRVVREFAKAHPLARLSTGELQQLEGTPSRKAKR